MANRYPQRIKTPEGTLLIRKNRAGQLIWRVIGRNGEKISGSTEAHPKRGTIARSIAITRAVLDASVNIR